MAPLQCAERGMQTVGQILVTASKFGGICMAQFEEYLVFLVSSLSFDV